jgi:uncharacterized protein
MSWVKVSSDWRAHEYFVACNSSRTILSFVRIAAAPAPRAAPRAMRASTSTSASTAPGPFVVVLSPAKALNERAMTSAQSEIVRVSTPRFAERANALAACAKKELSAGKIKSLMGVSDAIASLNAKRFQTFEKATKKPCVLAFDGPAFKHLDAPSFTTVDEVEYLQRHLRILSGLYGTLKPYDDVAPYRLEMGTKWAAGDAKDLYEYWGDDIANALVDDVEALAKESNSSTPFVVNCASQEYFKSVKLDVLKTRGVPVYTMTFPGPSVYAKQARGAMVRHCVDAKVRAPEDLKTFQGVDGEWRFDAKASTEFNFVFTRGAAAKTATAKRPATKKTLDQSKRAKAGG